MRAYLCNIGPFEFFFSRSYGQFQILPCPAHLPYVMTIIDDKQDRIDMGESNYMPYPVQGQEIAKDLVENEQLAPHGVFVSKGAKPTQAELDKALAVRTEYYKKMLAEGDGLWAKYHRHELINDNSRRAAIFLGEEREWSGKIVAKIACPGCGSMIVPNIARHSCGWVVDIEKAYVGGLIDAPTRDRLRKARAAEARAAEAKAKPAETDTADEYEDPAETVANANKE